MQRSMDLDYAARFGRRLRVARRKARVSAQVLGGTIDVHRNTIFRWESGLATPRIDTVARLKDALLVRGARL